MGMGMNDPSVTLIIVRTVTYNFLIIFPILEKRCKERVEGLDSFRNMSSTIASNHQPDHLLILQHTYAIVPVHLGM